MLLDRMPLASKKRGRALIVSRASLPVAASTSESGVRKSL